MTDLTVVLRHPKSENFPAQDIKRFPLICKWTISPAFKASQGMVLIFTAHSEHNTCRAISTSSVLLAALNYAWLTPKPQGERNWKPGFSTTKCECHLPFKLTSRGMGVGGGPWKGNYPSPLNKSSTSSYLSPGHKEQVVRSLADRFRSCFPNFKWGHKSPRPKSHNLNRSSYGC